MSNGMISFLMAIGGISIMVLTYLWAAGRARQFG